MEYYIFITHRCNMSCSYCSARHAVSQNPIGDNLSNDQILKIADYIKRDINARQVNGDENRIVFFGGEPLLAVHIIRDLLQATSQLRVSYSLFTNGLALDRVPSHILSAMDIIFVSFDGDKDAQEKHRAPGSYERIIKNIIATKRRISVPLLGRLTVEESTDLFKSVTTMLNLCDHVYWQIVNKAHFENPGAFIRNYESGIEKLFEFWLDHLRRGKILPIIPFQALARSLMNGRELESISFRCGCGSIFQAIDIDGTVYGCDEYVGTSLGHLGNINTEVPFSLRYQSHKDLFSECVTCKNSEICLGRCKRMLQTFEQDQIRIYCRLTNHLIDLVRENMQKIESSLGDHDLQEIYISPPVTEEIP